MVTAARTAADPFAAYRARGWQIPRAEFDVPASPAFAPYAHRLASVWRPRPSISTEQWAEREVCLPSETSSAPGPYRISGAPYARGIFRMFDDPLVFTIIMCWATQITKTTILQLLMGKVAATCPAPMLIATPDQATTRKLRDKFKLLAYASPGLRSIVPKPRGWNDYYIGFESCIGYLGWARSTQTLSGESCKYVFKTELDRWKSVNKQGSSSKKADERPKRFYCYKIVEESSPTDETSDIWAAWENEESRRHHYMVPCPHCGHFQELRFFANKKGKFAGAGGIRGLQDETGAWLGAERVRREAWYQCEANGCRIDSRHKSRMNQRGVWLPEGQRIDIHGNVSGTPDCGPRRCATRLGSIYSETISFGDMAAEYLNRRGHPDELRTFFNDWLALKFDRAGRKRRPETYGLRLAVNHRRETVHPKAFFLSAAADVQDDRVYYVIRGWGNGSKSWLVHFGLCRPKLTDEGELIKSSDLDQLDELVLNRRFPVFGGTANPLGRANLRVRLMNIDIQGHRQLEVFEWVKRRQLQGIERIRMVAGDTRIPAGEFFRLGEVERHAATGKTYEGGLARWRINVNAYKTDIRSRWDQPIDLPGAWLLYDEITLDGMDYLRQICNEEPRLERVHGKDQMVWKMHDERVGNHYWDCEVYARCAADMIVGFDWADLMRQAGPRKVKRSDRPDDERRASPYGPR